MWVSSQGLDSPNRRVSSKAGQVHSGLLKSLEKDPDVAHHFVVEAASDVGREDYVW
jgi:hypothetical protein